MANDKVRAAEQAIGRAAEGAPVLAPAAPAVRKYAQRAVAAGKRAVSRIKGGSGRS